MNTFVGFKQTAYSLTHTAHFSSVKRKEAYIFFLGENELFASLLLVVFVIAFIVMYSCVKT